MSRWGTRSTPLVRRVLVAIAVWGGAVDPLSAQGVVGGRVVELGSHRPVGCLSVSLLDSADRAVARTQTRDDGTFDVPAPSTGHYRWEFAAFGLQSVRTVATPLDAASDDERDYLVELVPHDSLPALWRANRSDSVPRLDARVRAPMPPFPPVLIEHGITRGQAVLAFVVDARGRSDSTTAFRLHASAPEIFDVALAMVHNGRQRPARRDGTAVCRLVVGSFSIERQVRSVSARP